MTVCDQDAPNVSDPSRARTLCVKAPSRAEPDHSRVVPRWGCERIFPRRHTAEGLVLVRAQRRSRIVAVASAPPQHIEIKANVPSRRSSSWSAVVISRLPVAPTG